MMILLNRSDMRKFVQGLSDGEASLVLKHLLDDTPDLMRTVYDIAVKVAGDVNADDITCDVFHELDMLDVDNLSGRSGRTRYGYVDPGDAAWEIFEEALQPFVDEMKKNQQRSLPVAAKAYCVGIIKGLVKYEEESSSEFKDWVTDAPGEYIDTVIDEWKKGNPNGDDVAEVTSFVKD
jgi:hypothetical protein